MNKKAVLIPSVLLLALIGQGCYTRHKVETVSKIEVAPMHITIDINVKVDKALDDFFGDLDHAEEKMDPKAP